MDPDLNTPTISVLLPVYNSSKYLKFSIESMLAQTFSDFELIIINDGSTDESDNIIRSFKDKRIVYYISNYNQGLIRILNFGISVAKGEWIARMDADDIALPERFEEQLNYAENNAIEIVATKIKLIDDLGFPIGSWPEDSNHTSSDQIENRLPQSNCIAHPSILIRTTILKKYGYSLNQKNSEDWDLWLRLISDGYKIGKIDKELLLYRIHAESITVSSSMNGATDQKIIYTKLKFLLNSIAKLKFNMVQLKVGVFLIRNIARYWKLYKFPKFFRSLKWWLTISPFKAKAEFKMLKDHFENNSSKLICFFPYTHIGGAEKVHIDIIEALSKLKPTIIFTGFSKNEKFLNQFSNNGYVLNIPSALYHPVFAKHAENLIKVSIEKAKPKLLGCNSEFYFRLLPAFSKDIFCSNLFHDFIFVKDKTKENQWCSAFDRMDLMIFISEKARQNMFMFNKYHRLRNGKDRLVLIPNSTEIPEYYSDKNLEEFNIIFVGRGSSEKRIDIILRIAEKIEDTVGINFHLVGDLSKFIPASVPSNVSVVGEILDNNDLKSIYKKADILLITSNREGFPMVIMEAMARGVIPVATPVGDIPRYITSYENGFVSSSIDPNIVVEEMVKFILILYNDLETRIRLSKNSYLFAKENFSISAFEKSYRKIFYS